MIILQRRSVCVLSHAQLFVIPWTVARQAPLSLEVSRQEYWSGLSFPSQKKLRVVNNWKLSCCKWPWDDFKLPQDYSSSVQSLSRVRLFVPPWTAQARLPCPLPTPGACSKSCPLSPWCHPTISSSVIPFSSRLQSFPASGSFPMSQFFASGGQSIGQRLLQDDF